MLFTLLFVSCNTLNLFHSGGGNELNLKKEMNMKREKPL